MPELANEHNTQSLSLSIVVGQVLIMLDGYRFIHMLFCLHLYFVNLADKLLPF